MVTYKHAIGTLIQTFPEIDSNMLDADNSIFSYSVFARFLIDKIKDNDVDFIKRSALFLDEITSTEEVEMQALVDEFVITLEENKKVYEIFKSYLASNTVAVFDKIISYWNRRKDV
jgi:sRNA-binding regulator protein Hfq